MGSLLSKISCPSDVGKLSLKEKQLLCQEIRDEIISVVSANGGHLASNLGVVELTVALFSVFDMEKDTVVWDVGHQIYAHKLLTGRNKTFPTLRTYGGLSGFPSHAESRYDPFTTGHSSASISSALGIAAAERISGKPDTHTIAVIGDGSLTGGLAFEGINNAGRFKKNFIVILNDNEMSISKNVGGLAKYLGILRTKPGYIRAKTGVEKAVEAVPVVGEPVAGVIRKFKNNIRNDIYNSTIFEDLGLSYYGPFDGHDLPLLIDTLNNIKSIDKPILLHIRTKKGKGYNYAELKPNLFHGVGSFDAYSGKLEPSGKNFSSVFGETLSRLAAGDERICAVTAAMSSGTGLVGFSRRFPERFFDVGIAEGHAVTFSAGLSRGGMLPVFAVYSTFLQRAYDNIMHDAALQDVKMVLAVDRAGLVGEDGKTHHGMFDVNYLGTIPGITVFSPCYYSELSSTLEKVLGDDSVRLAAVRYPRGKEGSKPKGFVPSGKDFDVIGDPDADTAVVCFGRIFSFAAEAVSRIRYENTGAGIKIVKLNRIIPLPEEAVRETLGCRKVLFFEEAYAHGGIGEAFALKLLTSGSHAEFELHAVEEGFVTHGTMQQLLHEVKLDADGIYESMKKSMEEQDFG